MAGGFHRSGDLRRAQRLYREALDQEPENAAAWRKLGEVYRALRRPGDAAECYMRALELAPDDFQALNNLGVALMGMGKLDEAAACFEQALLLQPNLLEASSNLGLVLFHQGKIQEALVKFRHVAQCRPDLAQARNNLGMALLNLGRGDEAVASFRQALRLRPDLADAQNNLGLALAARGNAEEAMVCYERAIALDPHHAGALANLGNALKDDGRVVEAVARYRQALALQPEDARLHSNLLLALNYQPGVEPSEILREARRYAERHAAPLACPSAPHSIRTLEGRRLRIGYVSADFRDHPVAYFLEPVLASHDREHFEIFCYADVPRPDAVTRRLQGHADAWRSLTGLSDEQAAQLVRQDEIDVLVDVAGHTGCNRLLMFVRQPAPVQASYLGYLGSTGLAAIDYYITDAYADPPGVTDAHFQERLVRLPECAFCYWPGPAPEVQSELPARRGGRVTFGCLNTAAKLSEEVLVLWAEVLASVPGSRLALPRTSRRTGEWLRQLLARHGVSSERLLLLDRTGTRFDYLKLCQGIDLCLDPFPYNGVTTTCDALWMGVPVLTLSGRTSVSRQGVRFLRSIGLQELIAETAADYRRRATELACNLRTLEALRCGLRERMKVSPLMDAPRLAGDLEAAYRVMWDQLGASVRSPQK